jgi:DNA-binding response OmpR family regulator
MMPLMDGWTFRREQLLDGDLARIPVVILSAAGDVRRAAAALRASAFVVKPFRMAELLKTVQRVLDRGSAAAAH